MRPPLRMSVPLAVVTCLFASARAEEPKAKTLELKNVPANVMKAANQAAPGVKWESAEMEPVKKPVKDPKTGKDKQIKNPLTGDMETQYVDSEDFALSGTDAKEHQVEVSVDKDDNSTNVKIHLDANELPQEVKLALFAKDLRYRWQDIFAEGRTSKNIAEYVLSYESVIVSVKIDGKKVIVEKF